MNRLKDKRALITGGSSGIGLQTARQFLEEGAQIAITSNDQKSLDAARQELGPNVFTALSDASDPDAQKLLAKNVAETFGKLDVLFVNAGIVDMRPLEQIDSAAFDRSFNINVKGPFFLVQACCRSSPPPRRLC